MRTPPLSFDAKRLGVEGRAPGLGLRPYGRV